MDFLDEPDPEFMTQGPLSKCQAIETGVCELVSNS